MCVYTNNDPKVLQLNTVHITLKNWTFWYSKNMNLTIYSLKDCHVKEDRWPPVIFILHCSILRLLPHVINLHCWYPLLQTCENLTKKCITSACCTLSFFSFPTKIHNVLMWQPFHHSLNVLKNVLQDLSKILWLS